MKSSTSKSTSGATASQGKRSTGGRNKNIQESGGAAIATPSHPTSSRTTGTNRRKGNATTTRVTANADIGMGNTLYIRGGAEAGLSWDQGIALENTGPDQWVWKTDGLKSPVEFKFLINDEIWSLNENFSITPGQIETFRPAF